jgi:hypothetical protein
LSACQKAGNAGFLMDGNQIKKSEPVLQAQVPGINLEAIQLELVVVDTDSHLLINVVASANTVIRISAGEFLGCLRICSIRRSTPCPSRVNSSRYTQLI